MRVLWALLGVISLGLGIAGVALPLLPTVPFILLAAFCFARSSQRMHDWLTEHQRFGPIIRDWRENGAISPRVKRISTISIFAVFALSLVLGVRPLVLGIQALVLSAVLIFIWSRPN